jgi:hypothetical protein
MRQKQKLAHFKIDICEQMSRKIKYSYLPALKNIIGKFLPHILLYKAIVKL